MSPCPIPVMEQNMRKQILQEHQYSILMKCIYDSSVTGAGQTFDVYEKSARFTLLLELLYTRRRPLTLRKTARSQCSNCSILLDH